MKAYYNNHNMMKAYYDLHIHSILSSCADVLQTPNNILNMCMLKGLNIISICDHNTSKQYKTIDMIKDSFDFLVLYGIEITVKEGFHVLAYFENYDEIMELDEIIDKTLDKTISPPDEQIICDINDEELEKVPYFINQRIGYSFSELIPIIRKLNGLIIPAHIDRAKTGILEFIPDFSSYDIDAIEIYNIDKKEELFHKYPYLTKYQYLCNSDAHDIEMIHEMDYSMDVDDLTFASFKKWLNSKEIHNE